MMTISTIKRLLQAIGIWFLLIFGWFVVSGMPGFYDPYKLDGKGINPHLYLCDGFRRGPVQCEAREYWSRILPVAGIKTVVVIVALPILLVSFEIRYHFWVYLIPIGLFFLLSYRAKQT
jgi:hypothetical protein